MFKNVFTFASVFSSCSLMVSSKEVARFAVFYFGVLSEFSGAQLIFVHPPFYFIYNNYLYPSFYSFTIHMQKVKGVSFEFVVTHQLPFTSATFSLISRFYDDINENLTILKPIRKCAPEIMDNVINTSRVIPRLGFKGFVLLCSASFGKKFLNDCLRCVVRPPNSNRTGNERNYILSFAEQESPQS